jgi:exopolysaccharide biosynthesis WecB/TagA/CpsF family protein
MQTITAKRVQVTDTTINNRLHFSRGEFSILPQDSLNRKPPIQLFGLPLANATLADAAQEIVARAVRGQRSIIQFVNAHCINSLKSSAAYSRALSVADTLLGDGSGMRLAARFAGVETPPNLNGTDLFPHLCNEAAENDQPIFLLGGGEGVAEKAGEAMERKNPKLRIAGCTNGFWSANEEAALIERINASGATILLVGLGVPKQEKWIARNRNRISVPVVLGVGGLFDYYSGRIPRAPQWMRSFGAEWVWRFLQEPRRLASRYLVGNTVFVFHSLIHAWSARGHADSYANASKRTLDIAIALLALVLLGPIFAAICLLVTMEDRGPVFFKQTRIGANGKPFKMWKFRSMSVDAEARRASLLAQSERDSTCFKMKHDPRITRIGAIIRRASLDELPQLVNVLKGEMSIVGPRPALPSEVITYQERERGRLHGKPGITCIWQVSGRAEIPFEQQVEMDIHYLSRKSIAQDIGLIAKTIPAVLTGRGAY